MSEVVTVEEKPFWRRDNPVVWGLLASLILASVVVLAAFHRGEDGVSGAAAFLNLNPNEIGDTLAGLFSSLAFIWIVVTVFLQSQELTAQREELVLARAEAKRTADALADQVELLQVQGSIFKDEQRQRNEKSAAELLEQYFEGLRELIVDAKASVVRGKDGRLSEGQVFANSVGTDKGQPGFFREFRDALTRTKRITIHAQEPERRSLNLFDVQFFSGLLRQVNGICDLLEELSAAQKLRIEQLRINWIKTELSEILDYQQKHARAQETDEPK